MAFSRKLLGEDETVELDLHQHWKALIKPILLAIVIAAVAIVGGWFARDTSTRSWIWLAIAVVAVVLLCWATIWPILTWWTTAYVITDKRIITRAGVIARRGRDMPISRVNDVSFNHKNLLERMLGCGTLEIESAGERGQLLLTDVPHVDEVQRTVYALHEAYVERHGDEPDRPRSSR